MTAAEQSEVNAWIKDKRKEILSSESKPTEIVVDARMHDLLMDHAALGIAALGQDWMPLPNQIMFHRIPVVAREQAASA